MDLTVTVQLATSCNRWHGIEMYSARVYLVGGDNTIRVVYVYMYTKTSYG